MTIETMECEVKDEILSEVIKKAEKIVEPIIFSEYIDNIKDTDDDCEIKPYAIFLKNIDGKLDLRMLFSYYDTYAYEACHLRKNDILRKGETVENSLSVFNVYDIINILNEIPLKYKFNIDRALKAIKAKIIKLIKQEIIKNNNYYKFDDDSSYELSVLTSRSFHSLTMKGNNIYVKYYENDVFGFSTEKNRMINTLSFNDVFKIALYLSYEY